MKKPGRRIFFKKAGLGLFAFPALRDATFFSHIRDLLIAPDKVSFTTGYKVMEVHGTSALVWTRLCGQETPNPVRHARREQVFRHPIDFDESQPVEKMDGFVKGAAGMARVRLTNNKESRTSGWMEATEENDFTVSFRFDGLRADTRYDIEIEGKALADGPSKSVRGTFTTMPDSAAVKPLNFVTSTCQYFWSYDDARRGFRAYDSMRKLKPDFFIHTGDYVYYDKPGPLATTLEKARHKWRAMDAWPSIRELYTTTPIYMIKDDHDLLRNDAWPGIAPYGDLSFEEGLKIWHENVPLRGKPYRTIRWGKDVQIWLVEGREFRSPNKLADSAEKTIWGAEQKQWFVKSVEASDATFKLLLTPTPVVGPDRKQKIDNHANTVFETEGKWLRSYLSQQRNMYVVNGDRHWQYVSKDAETGLMEFGSGPVSDYHAQGWDPEDVRPEHRFLRLKGGFLNIRVDREKDKPLIEFIHCDVDGRVVHVEKFSATA